VPADLVPNEAIPELAVRIDSAMREVLRRIQQTGFILNGRGVDRETVAILQRLTDLGLVDPGYEGPTVGEPYLWTSNGNGSRVLRYSTGIRASPHYEIPSTELASWLEQQGTDRWWYVDGDPLLTGRLTFPCPADELAAELRKIDRPLLVQAKQEDVGAKGQVIEATKLNEAVARFTDVLRPSGPTSVRLQDRVLYLCWKRAFDEWLLAEDSETTDQMRADEKARAGGVSQGR
jgi:hypothetical protein